MIAFTMHWRVAWSMLPKPDALYHGPGTTQESVQTQMMSRKPSEFPGSEELTRSHLLKWPSDLKTNGTQENVTYSGSAFHGLPCGVLLFDASVSFQKP